MCMSAFGKIIGSDPLPHFLGLATADILYSEFELCCSILAKERITQLSMDWPNVNWKVFSDLSEDINTSTQDGKKLYNVGSCELHVMHNAIEDGYKETGWNIEHCVNALYWLFHDSPTHRVDFLSSTGCSLFSKKLCTH